MIKHMVEVSITELTIMRDQRYLWLVDSNNLTSPYYNKIREEYESFNKTIIDYYNSKQDRKVKIAVACLTGAIGILGLGVTGLISNSSAGAKFESSTRGMTGKLLSSLWH